MSIIITNGTSVSPGIKIGKAHVISSSRVIIPKYMIKDAEISTELERFNNAVKQTKIDISKIQKQLSQGLSKDLADIFTSHLMVLEDPLIVEKAKNEIIQKKRNAEWIINDISVDLVNSLNTIEDEYLRERIIDITDIYKRLISNLQQVETRSLSDIKEEVIIFANDLTPSETALMNKMYIMAFVTDHGGKTSHTSIMARALEIPAIVGTINGTSLVKTGDTVIVDAIHGQIIIDPTEEEIKEYEKYQDDFRELELELAKLTTLPSQTLDNEEIFIYGNIEIPEETSVIKNHGAQGIGLYRSEYLFMDKSLPDEEKQFREYKKVVEFFNPFPVTIRTIDIGGDKIFTDTKPQKERNPFLGCRAIRFSLQHKEIFKVQLRAILRASHYGNANLMFPMITTLDEFLKAKSITLEVMDDLEKEGIPFNKNIPTGLMIEVPSAAINADVLSRYADFFSVGTNDLVQYTLAVDRIYEKIAYLYNPLNLSILRLLKNIVDVSNRYNIPLSICGEMAGEPQYTMVLLGLGFRHFSMGPAYMYQIKKIIRSITIDECEKLVNTLLELENTEEIEKRVRAICREKFQEILF